MDKMLKNRVVAALEAPLSPSTGTDGSDPTLR